MIVQQYTACGKIAAMVDKLIAKFEIKCNTKMVVCVDMYSI